MTHQPQWLEDVHQLTNDNFNLHNPVMLHVLHVQRKNKLRRAYTSARIIQKYIRQIQQRRRYLHIRNCFITLTRHTKLRLIHIKKKRNCGNAIANWSKKLASKRITERLYMEQLKYKSATTFQNAYRSMKSRRRFQYLIRLHIQDVLQFKVVPKILHRQANAVQSHAVALTVTKSTMHQGILLSMPHFIELKEEYKRIVRSVASHQWNDMVQHHIVPNISDFWKRSIRISKWYRYHKIRKFNYLKRRFILNRAANVVQRRWRILKWRKITARAKVMKMMADHRIKIEKVKKKKERKEYKKRLKQMEHNLKRRQAIKKAKENGEKEPLLIHIEVSSPSSSETEDTEEENSRSNRNGVTMDGRRPKNDEDDKDDNDFTSKNMIHYMEALCVVIIQRNWRKYHLIKFLQARIVHRRSTQIQIWWKAIFFNVTFKRHLFLRVRLRKLEHKDW